MDQHMPWRDKEMQAAIKEFRSSGDASEMLRVIGAAPDKDPMLEIHRALSLTRRRFERDALEDAALAVSGNAPPRVHPSYVNRVAQLAREEFGVHVDRFVDIAALAQALTAAANDELPAEAVAAVAGVEAARVIGDTLPIGPMDFGSTAVYFRTNCQECGGASGGAGLFDGDPNRPCACRKEVDVSHHVNNGQIVTGRFSKSGQPGWFTLRLEQ